MNQKLKEYLEEQGYQHLKEIDGVVYGLERMAFTTGLFKGLTKHYREGRWCYPDFDEARLALEEWDGKGDPPGNWIKYKGKTEYNNPSYKNYRDESIGN